MIQTMKGTIAFYNSKKRWGFIDGEDGESYFLHHSNIIDKNIPLSEGFEVEFKPETSERGPIAKEVAANHDT